MATRRYIHYVHQTHTKFNSFTHGHYIQLTDLQRKVKGLKRLRLQPSEDMGGHKTPLQSTPPHKPLTQGDPFITTSNPSPREAYELGMHSQPAWHGEYIIEIYNCRSSTYCFLVQISSKCFREMMVKRE